MSSENDNLVPKPHCLVFFEGTAENINSKTEKELGRSHIAEFYMHTAASPIDLKMNVDWHHELGKSKYQDIKVYFPGPGAPKSKHDNPHFANSGNPGRKSLFPIKAHKSLLPRAKSFKLKVLNQIFGNGWEHNMMQASTFIANLPLEKYDIIVAGFSRGAITAIALSNQLSQMGIEIKHLLLLDPVAGNQYGYVQNFFKYDTPKHNGLPQVNPFIIGDKVLKADIFYATHEFRAPFLPQLPVKYGSAEQNPCPLLIHDSTEARIHFVRGDHGQVSSLYFVARKKDYGAGQYTFKTMYEIFDDYDISLKTYTDNILKALTGKRRFNDIEKQPRYMGYKKRVIAHRANNIDGYTVEKYKNSYSSDLAVVMNDYIVTEAPHLIGIIQNLNRKPAVCKAFSYLITNYQEFTSPNQADMNAYGPGCRSPRVMQEFIREILTSTSPRYSWRFISLLNPNKKGRNLDVIINDIGAGRYGKWDSSKEADTLKHVVKITLCIRGKLFKKDASSSSKRTLKLLNANFSHYKKIIQKALGYDASHKLDRDDLLKYSGLSAYELKSRKLKQTIYNNLEMRNV
ncbi:DUF2235 domain-containing protein [Lentisphaerota bacterium ZTH]|nr:DUF2235 domain-containing protein [Lentisphaerota bacterium]WET05755.1 DUF2235 domain-containing protein [Lentisphaerota bacterium ZTH]